MDFCWTGLREAGGCVKSMCACLCIMIVGGPILIIIGIVLLVAENTREKDVKEYNDAVAAYDPAPVDNWQPGGLIQYVSVSLTNQPNPIEGNRDGITEVGTSRMVYATLSARNSYLVTLNSVSSFTMSSIDTSKSKTVTARCQRNNGCTRNQMEAYCQSNYGLGSTFIGTSCSEGACGSCTYVKYLSTVCGVVTSTSPYTRDSRYSSCFYPFGNSDQEYEFSSSSQVSVYIRKADDPFIALQRITEGKNDFGLTAAQQRTMGLALLIIGGVLILCVILVACLIVHLIKAVLARNQIQPQPQAVGTQSIVVVAPGQVITHPPATNPGFNSAPPPGYAPQQGPYGYGAQQPQLAPGYSQPQPGYGQPQPGYGQPQPAYGQPQSGYGQPQQGFNNPPPAIGYPVPANPPPNKGPDFGY